MNAFQRCKNNSNSIYDYKVIVCWNFTFINISEIKYVESRSPFSPHLNFLLLHNSMRYQRIFNIINTFKRFIIELQIKSLCIYFEDWVLKLLSYITWKLSFNAELFDRQTDRFFYFIYWTLTHQKNVFLKKHPRAPLFIH